ncbi:MAG: hypothetical protein AB7N80_07410 [Bdellovibrionales bacterium]
MKKQSLTLILAAAVFFPVLSGAADDPRDTAVLNSKFIHAVLRGLQEEQAISCQIAVDESKKKTIDYFTEDSISKFRAMYFCSDERTLFITGVIGDSGQTASEKVELVRAAN